MNTEMLNSGIGKREVKRIVKKYIAPAKSPAEIDYEAIGKEFIKALYTRAVIKVFKEEQLRKEELELENQKRSLAIPFILSKIFKRKVKK